MKPDETACLETAVASTNARDYESAIVALKRLLSFSPEHELALGMLAATYAELKMTERAVEYYQRLLNINPTNPLACVQLSLIKLAVGQPREVLSIWQARLQEPDEFLAPYYSGLALLQLEQPAEARSMFNEAAKYVPTEHVLYPQLQALLHDLGN